VQTSATFFVTSITVNDLRDLYGGNRRQLTYSDKPINTTTNFHRSSSKVRILIVPGHEPDFGGTEFRGINERDLVVEMANDLATLLKTNRRYEVFVARSTSAWDPTLTSYFSDHWSDIAAFRDAQINEMQTLVGQGKISIQTDAVFHQPAPNDVAIRLYGINQWATENNIDLTVHLHLNDYSGHRQSSPGVYAGYTVYVPEHQYSNAAASRTVGEAIAARLGSFHAPSTLPQESRGVVDDQELIAVGSNNSADAASVLIEYGYIYEPQFTDASVRPIALSDYAYETYLGLQDFFNDPTGSKYGSTVFPYDWNSVAIEKGASGPGVYALQAALHYLHYYPPTGKSFSDCPIAGRVGDCTIEALTEFQRAIGLDPTGTFGPETHTALTGAL
jgi:N-acetylmuramoyl-L-alanine amidase